MPQITVPDQNLILGINWLCEFPARENKSMWTGSTKISGLPGAETWSAKARLLARTTIATQRPWRAFFMALRGVQNTFELRAACIQRTGSNPTVAAGANAGYTLPLTGLPASQVVLVAGCYMTVPLPSGHKRLVCLTQDLISNASGNATAQFGPALRETPTTGTVVETKEPYALVRNAEPKASWQDEAFAFDVVEAI